MAGAQDYLCRLTVRFLTLFFVVYLWSELERLFRRIYAAEVKAGGRTVDEVPQGAKSEREHKSVRSSHRARDKNHVARAPGASAQTSRTGNDEDFESTESHGSESESETASEVRIPSQVPLNNAFDFHSAIARV